MPACRPTDTVTLSIILILTLATTSLAYPPAPSTIIHGTVRDQYGWVISDPTATIVFRQGGNVVASTPVRGDSNSSENYRVQIPLDSNRTSAPYRSNVASSTIPFVIEVVIDGAVYHPVETLTNPEISTSPGTTIELDLTLGEDTDGDSLPDDWELWQLQLFGLYPGHPDYNLDQFGTGDKDGDGISDFDEYIAGTFAYLASDTVILNATDFREDGFIELEYFAVIGKNYQLEAADALLTWSTEPVALDSPTGPAATAWASSDTNLSKIYIFDPERRRKFFRLRVR